MDSIQFNLNKNGVYSINSPTGESFQLNGNDVTNNKIIREVIKSRLDFLNPQIGEIKKHIPGAVNMSPIEKAKFKYLKLRVSNLETERNALLNLVDKFKANSSKTCSPDDQFPERIDTLRLNLKQLVEDNNPPPKIEL